MPCQWAGVNMFKTADMLKRSGSKVYQCYYKFEPVGVYVHKRLLFISQKLKSCIFIYLVIAACTANVMMSFV